MDAKRVPRVRGAAGASLVLLALGIAGCSASGTGAVADATTTAPATPTTASSTPSASGSTAPSPSPTCFNTTMVGDTTVRRYLANLPGVDRTLTPGLVMDLDGLRLKTDTHERPCQAVPVKISRFSVQVSHTGPATARRPVLSYTALGTLGVTIGPADGTAEGSAPPATAPCTGVLSVVHLGEPVPVAKLPDKLLISTPDPAGAKPFSQSVTVTGDYVVTAGLTLPGDIASC
ncbi:hypothetical protein ACWDRR_26550 [Kitasatospora sp. NPDC003701]